MGGLRPQPKVPRCSLTRVGCSDEDDEDGEVGGKEEEEEKEEEYLSDCSGGSSGRRRSLHPSRPRPYHPYQPGRRCNVAEEDPPRRPRVRRDW